MPVAQRAGHRLVEGKQGSNELLTLAQVLAELYVPKSTFFRWKALGVAPKTIKYPNGSLRIRRKELERWLNGCEEVAR